MMYAYMSNAILGLYILSLVGVGYVAEILELHHAKHPKDYHQSI